MGGKIEVKPRKGREERLLKEKRGRSPKERSEKEESPYLLKRKGLQMRFLKCILEEGQLESRHVFHREPFTQPVWGRVGGGVTLHLLRRGGN